MPGDERETVTQQDLTEFRTFLLEQLLSHTSELSAKFEKGSTDAECALSVSKQLKVESELEFSYPGNERNYKFNFEVLDLLESVSKALLVQGSVKASLLLNDSIKLIKERNRKIRTADSSEGGLLTVKHYESNAVALDLEDDKTTRAAEREALRVKTRTRAKRQNAERVQGRYPPFSQPYTFEDTSSVVSSPPQPLLRTSNPGFPTIAKEVLSGSVAPPDIGGESVPSGLPEPSPPKMLFTLPEQVPARPPHANSRSQFLDNLSSSVSDLLCTGQGSVSTVSQPDVSQEFMTLMEDKFTDNSSLAFYKQSLYEYEQGTAALTLVPLLVGDMPFLLTWGSLNCFTKLFPLWNLFLIAMVGNCLLSFTRLTRFKSLTQDRVV